MWSGDTCGQGFGINEELRGLATYAAILRTRPDLFVHCGDTVYADLEIPPPCRRSRARSGATSSATASRRSPRHSKKFRGRHRYVLQDQHVRTLYAEVPTIAQWDDHETFHARRDCSTGPSAPGGLLEGQRLIPETVPPRREPAWGSL
ncbi:alkaline phosphatase D family protein [Nocardioides sp. LHG3406-4]|uniref:alkaline phosphatase D family protein n=1 Tax=Nocardioides sp. LHG3406-4 TaxID=2804575 RepID=UPI003CF7D7DB